jgi:beta-1,4-N-acetylglucosaminyltransferase
VIFVSVGSGDFDPLVRAMDAICEHRSDLHVIMQIGLGQYEPRCCEFFRFASSLASYYDRADLIIAHGGVGVTLEVLSRRIPLIGVDNPDRPDHHQEDLLSHLSEQGHLVWCRDLGRLERTIDSMAERTLVPWTPDPCTVHHHVEEFLQQLLRT